MITQHRLGALEMMAGTGGSYDTSTSTTVAGIDNLAYAFPDWKTALAALDGDLGALIRKDLARLGIFAFERVYPDGFRHFTTSTKPIHNADDLRGLKLRVAHGNLFYDTFRSLGTSIVTVDASAIYTSLQTHLVDAQENGLLLIEVDRFYEVQKYCSLSHHMWVSVWITVNMDKWNALPRSFQEIMRKHIDAAALLDRRDVEISDDVLRDKLERQGLLFNDVDVASLKAKLISSGYYARWREAYGPAAWATPAAKYSGTLGA